MSNTKKQTNSKGAHSFAQRLRQARKHAGMTQQQLADKTDLSKSSIQKLESGRSKSTPSVVALAAACAVHSEWLQTGQGVMTVGDGQIPLITLENLANWKNWLRGQPTPTPVISWIDDSCALGATGPVVAFYADSDIMTPTIDQNDLVMVELTTKVKHNSIAVVAVSKAARLSVKRWVVDGDKVCLVPDNNRYPVDRYRPSEITVYGSVLLRFNQLD